MLPKPQYRMHRESLWLKRFPKPFARDISNLAHAGFRHEEVRSLLAGISFTKRPHGIVKRIVVLWTNRQRDMLWQPSAGLCTPHIWKLGLYGLQLITRTPFKAETTFPIWLAVHPFMPYMNEWCAYRVALLVLALLLRSHVMLFRRPMIASSTWIYCPTYFWHEQYISLTRTIYYEQHMTLDWTDVETSMTVFTTVLRMAHKLLHLKDPDQQVRARLDDFSLVLSQRCIRYTHSFCFVYCIGLD